MVSKQTEWYSWSYDCHEIFLSLIYSLFSTYICSFMICEFGIIRKWNNKMFRVRPVKSTQHVQYLWLSSLFVLLYHGDNSFPLLVCFLLLWNTPQHAKKSSDLRFFSLNTCLFNSKHHGKLLSFQICNNSILMLFSKHGFKCQSVNSRNQRIKSH